VTIGPDLTFGGVEDGFIAKLSPTGTAFLYNGYIGGANTDEALAVAVDTLCATACTAYVAGNTQSAEGAGFPVTVGPDLTHNSLTDGFVAKVKGDGTGFAYAGYVGGTQDDNARGIAIDRTGAAYLTGDTKSSPAQPASASRATSEVTRPTSASGSPSTHRATPTSAGTRSRRRRPSRI
jgi:hypothetical protein